jgi:hypothetical protein
LFYTVSWHWITKNGGYKTAISSFMVNSIKVRVKHWVAAGKSSEQTGKLRVVQMNIGNSLN